VTEFSWLTIGVDNGGSVKAQLIEQPREFLTPFDIILLIFTVFYSYLPDQKKMLFIALFII
jgi:hypothetical protein